MAYSTPTGNYQAPNFSAILNPLAKGLAAKDTLMADKMKGDFLNQQAMNREAQRYAMQKQRRDQERDDLRARAELQQREDLAERIQATMLQAPNLFEAGLSSFDSNPLMNRSTPELMALEERIKGIDIDGYHRAQSLEPDGDYGKIPGNPGFGDGVRSMLGTNQTLDQYNDQTGRSFVGYPEYIRNLDDIAKEQLVEERFDDERRAQLLSAAVGYEKTGHIPPGMIDQIGGDRDALSRLVRAAEQTAQMEAALKATSNGRSLSDQDKSILLKDFMDPRDPRTGGLQYVEGLDPQTGDGFPEYSNFIPYLRRMRELGYGQRSTMDMFDQFRANQFAPRLRQYNRTIENQGSILQDTGAPLIGAVNEKREAVIAALEQMLAEKDESTSSVPRGFQSGSGGGYNPSNVANQPAPSVDLKGMDDTALALLLLDQLDYEEIEKVLPQSFDLTQAQIDYANARKDLRNMMNDPEFLRLISIMEPDLVESLGLSSGSANLIIGGGPN